MSEVEEGLSAEEKERGHGLQRAVRIFVEKLYQECHLNELMGSDVQGARNAVEVAFDELKAALFMHQISLKNKDELRQLIHAHVPIDHRFLYDDVIEWDMELDGLIQGIAPGEGEEGSAGLSTEDWEKIKHIGEGLLGKKTWGLSLGETSQALEELSAPRKTEGLSPDEVGAALEDLLPTEDLTQPKKVWERLMGCRDLSPHEYKVKARRILKAWKKMWDDNGKDDAEFQRLLYFMLRLAGEYEEALRKKRDDLNDSEVQKASHLHSALQIFSAYLAEDLARKGIKGKISISARAR